MINTNASTNKPKRKGKYNEDNYNIGVGFAEVPQKGDFDYENLPSKLGGLPVWLIYPDSIPDTYFQCTGCKTNLFFLSQIYCPLEDNPNCFHRVLYIFFCKNCWRYNNANAVKVLRCQLPEKSEFYVGEQLVADRNELELASEAKGKIIQTLLPEFLIDSCEENTAASRMYINFYDNIDEKSLKSKNMEDLEEVLEEEYDEMKDDKVDKMLEDYCKEQGIKIENIDDEGDFEEAAENEFISKVQKNIFKSDSDDIFYELFSKVLSYDPKQVIRYCRDDVFPLWFCGNGMLTMKNTKCKNCGGDLIFELQIMPHVFNLYKEIMNIDIGTIVIYTCKKSCGSQKTSKYGAFVEEQGFIQRTGEKVIDLNNSHNTNLSTNLSGGSNNCTLSKEELIKNMQKVSIKGNENNEPDDDGWVEVKKKNKKNPKEDK